MTRDSPDIAVIGMACRFPGAANPIAYWELLRDGREAVTETPPDRWRMYGLNGPGDAWDGLRRGGYLDDVGWRVYAEARKRGAYLRPLGSTVYVCPPLTIEVAELEELLRREQAKAALRVADGPEDRGIPPEGISRSWLAGCLTRRLPILRWAMQ